MGGTQSEPVENVENVEAVDRLVELSEKYDLSESELKMLSCYGRVDHSSVYANMEMRMKLIEFLEFKKKLKAWKEKYPEAAKEFSELHANKLEKSMEVKNELGWTGPSGFAEVSQFKELKRKLGDMFVY